MLKKGIHRLINSHPFFIRLFNWEYWPMQVLMLPVLFFWVRFSLKAKSGVFFSAANPGIDMGGFAGESKFEILKKFPASYVPITCCFSPESPMSEILEEVYNSGLSFPLIAKPDVGERGFRVKKILNQNELLHYIQSSKTDFLLQEYIDLPLEVGVLYYRFPDAQCGHISSLTLKKFLTISGDGSRTVEEIIKGYPRAKLQYTRLRKTHPELMGRILDNGETLELVPLGNHALGATFLNGNDQIDPALVQCFDQLFDDLDGIYFGRFDIKCKDLDALRSGKAYYILEFNGVKAEPTHIYQPGFSLWEAYRVLYKQWEVIYRISAANHERGIPYDPLIPTLRKIQAHQRYKKSMA